MKSHRSILCASVLAGIAQGFAVPAFADQPQDLDEVVVTATRTARTQDETLASVAVIDRDDIERLQPASLPELLRMGAGTALSNNGGAGKQTTLFLRGTESDHTLVLVDGMKIGSATSGGAALQDIPVEQIERIEIVRGPFSSLYGSEALGGVIQIFTRRPQGAFQPHASLSAGSFGTLRASAGVGGKLGDGWYAATAAHEHTDGIDALRDNPDSPFDDAGLDPDRDGYRNDSVSLQGGYRFSDAWDADARVLRAEGRNEYDGSVNNLSKIVQQVASARLGYAPSDAVSLTLRAGRADDLSDNYLDGAYSSTFETHRSIGSLQADIAAGESHLFTLGFDWLRDEVDSDTPYEVGRRINRGAFGQWQGEFGAHALQLGLRRDDDGQFGGKTTGSALWGWDFTDALRLTASYGTAYKAPTFNELYFPGYGNPNLGPENSRSAEIGLRGTHARGGWAVNAFQTRVDDLIAYDPGLVDAAHPFGQPNNIDSARIRGVEATGHVELAGWKLQGGLTWLDPRDRSDGANHGNVLVRRARRTARIDLDRSFGDFSIGAGVYAAGERYDDPANTVRMGGYALLDLRAGYAINRDWSMQASVANAGDRDYETAGFYRQPGRSYSLTLRYRPAE